MSEISNPPAFPFSGHQRDDGQWFQEPEQGMTLRDWFAGQAIAGMVCSEEIWIEEKRAKEAYALADAMLRERLK